MGEIAQVAEVLMQEASLVADAKARLERLDAGGWHRRPSLGDQRVELVARNRARDEEVERDREPSGDHVEGEPTNDKLH